MARLNPGEPVTQKSPLLKVDNRLAPGRHRFQLEVIDQAGLVSSPAFLDVTVTAPPTPTPTPSGGGRTRIDPRVVTRVDRRIITPIRPRDPRR